MHKAEKKISIKYPDGIRTYTIPEGYEYIMDFPSPDETRIRAKNADGKIIYIEPDDLDTEQRI